jgi:hypothetical protein
MFGLAMLITSLPLQAVQATHLPGTLLPDMGMDRVRNFRIDTSVVGQPRLFFTTIIINIGDGPMQVRGHTPQPDGSLLVDQQIFASDGTFTTLPSGFRMGFAGDEHSHWHVIDLATYELFGTGPSPVGTSDKQGFCLWDNQPFNLTLPDAPQSETYAMDGCGVATDTSVTAGLSVGWGDKYQDTLPTQFIDITGLPTGDYTLTATVDQQDFLDERCEGNNATSTILHIDATLNTVNVVQQGIASQACERVGATFVPLSPARLLDTRVGNGLSGPFSAGVPRTFQVTGRGGVPSNATAVTGNLTVTEQTKAGFVFLGPDPVASPTSSTLNFPLADNRANGVTVALGTGGTLSATYAAVGGGSTHLVFDVTGYFVPNTSGATFVPLSPARLLDTRVGNGLSGPFSAGVPRTFQVTGRGGVPSDATAVTGNLTVTEQTKAGFVFLGPAPVASPTSSTLNFPLADNRANGVTVALSGSGKLSATYAAVGGGTTQLVFDVTGYFVP